ncbi:NAD-dependent epimerase/dehydratase family protein [Variovorax terrae]|uniref:NAD-dependent epimerase/dehydratase family protein n=1 Tax=Variovorax terrae TaxID=2923278 RepID=A0A9X1VXV4_9BURK|nr:NAD-dependent epimerase/dehydratase family protein [Variovorax terrae]MCJ0765432.1 NAD-dependent epimerase/dehydratase family protein [Variovorax terrae]
MQRVLITGGAGFIGSHSAEALLAQGVQVRVLDNLSSGRRDRLPADALADGRLTLLEGDVRDARAVDAAVQGCDAVLHLAAQVSVQSSVAEPVASSSHNVTGFLNVIDAVRRLQVPRLVYASSAAVYGAPASLPLDEASVPLPLSPYGLEKFINDQYAALYRTLYGVSAIGMRYFNVYGPRQDPRSSYAGVISKFADGLESGAVLRVFGDGSQTRDFVYVGDVAEANRRALASGVQGVLNVGTGRSVSLLELIEAMTEAFGRPAQVRHEAPAAGDVLHSATTPARLQQALDYRPGTSLVQGLRALAASLRGA